MGPKNLLSADNLLKRIRAGFEQVKEHRASNAVISLSDVLMSAFAMFSLKDSSLLEFDGRREKDENLKQIYKIGRVPSDTQMRTILDEVSPEAIRPLFKDELVQLERSKVLSETEQVIFRRKKCIATLV